MRQILATLLVGLLLFLAHGVESHKAHHKKLKSKKPSPSIKNSKNSSLSTRARRSPPPPRPKRKFKRSPPPRRRPSPPSPRRKRPPPPRRRSPPPRASRSPPPPRSPRSPPPAPLVLEPTFYSYDVIQELPHNTSSFTQGLQYEEICNEPSVGGTTKCRDIFWESTGLYGRSAVKEVELSTGKTIRMRNLPDSDFGEGLTKLNDVLYQLTWKSGKTWTYHPDNFNNYKITKTPLNDGWGATHDGTNLIVGDSTDTLYFIDPSTMKTVRTIKVQDGNRTVKWLNELEYIKGTIYANVFTTPCIAQIDPNSGKVTGWLYMDGLRQQVIDGTDSDDPVPDALNGIAWDEKRKKLYVTGKFWPTMFHVRQKVMSGVSDEMKQKIREECIIDPMRPL
ncbi:putative Glutaminyl-peptide cyclotransferase [Nannochloris sp. 'desiccata']|nr:putative Glutaminyl-peptide cyclotransferase [Chlorella desiccata (nom. nud.)]